MVIRQAIACLALIGTAALPSACVAQPIADHIYSFGQSESGGWREIPTSDLSHYFNASKVVCSGRSSEIDVVWNSDSGDWAAYDKYSNLGPFFTRTIRFAQFDQAIEIVQDRYDSKPEMMFGGEDVEQYDFLLKELAIWTQESKVPFLVPSCASDIFAAK